ncbi:MAG TPA: DegT/DnrJ/EryC1/StrS family aminotransferase, partial [Gaiellaceae bacterium]|nr:DegT/DnrJ/EryC1/StrS family aminotransferase [Gaiellaceae bacterium]
MTLPLVDVRRQYRSIKDEIDEAIAGVLESGQFILGEEVDRFEREFAGYCGVRECIGVASGTAAIELALEALGVGAGDEVVAPANTFIATVVPVLRLGARPVLVDCDARTATIDVDRAADAITGRTKAVIAVHLYGQPADMRALRALCDERGLALVEDACQAHGARWEGRRVGGLGRVAAFSFYPGKNLGAFGDGGAVTTDDEALAERVRLLRDLGQRRKYEHVVVGGNERLDTLQAAILRVKLRHLDRWNEERRSHAAAYARALADGGGVALPATASWAEHVWHLYVVRSHDRDALRDALVRDGIGAGMHYPTPLHLQPALA